MEFVISFLLYLSPFAVVGKSEPITSLSERIPVSSVLHTVTEQTSWLSPSGQFAFGFYREGSGFAVGIWLEGSPKKKLVWTANRKEPPLASDTTLALQVFGLIITPAEPKPEIQITDVDPVVESASMLDNGNFVLYNSYSKVIWQSFDSPTDTILPGQNLYLYSTLASSVSRTNHSIGRFVLSTLSGGSHVLYPLGSLDPEADFYWSSYTTSGEFFTLKLDGFGRMYLINTKGSTVQNLTDGFDTGHRRAIYRATLDEDGIFRLYRHTLGRNRSSSVAVVWRALDDKCSVNGICGFNSYCTSTVVKEGQVNCTCLPGFDYIDPKDRSVGCSRRRFRSNEEAETNSSIMISIANLILQVDAYSRLRVMGEEDCKAACLEDSNCEGALFRSEFLVLCSKVKFPIRYGRIDECSSNVLFIKVAKRSTSASTKHPPISKTSIIILIIAAALTVCSLCAMAIFGSLIFKRWRVYRQLKRPIVEIFAEIDHLSVQSFSYNELAAATNGFSLVLGRGSFGKVYKGALPYKGRLVAVKRLEKLVGEGEREFRMEMKAIGRTHHRNLVRLIGFCHEGFNRLLVYEYIENGSLAELLFNPERRPNWEERVRITLEVARGIFYLHEECEPHVIHCDIKPQNILMDEFWTAKISDFGLAKLLMSDRTRTVTGPRGTRGYLAPEWYQNKPISVKVDVYSFGIVLLEILCCRRNLEFDARDDEIILSEWVYNCYAAGELNKLLCGEEVEKRQFERMVMVALWCIQRQPALRPPIKQVILMLEGYMDVLVPPSPDS